jgi:hypothetical protein
VVGSITSQENHCALAHELMHWTEDEVYTMNLAALSNSKAWWLEMAAENGSFLIDPGCIDRNLEQYGRAVTNDNLLPLQSASLVWNLKEGARYIQALQVYISLCEGRQLRMEPGPVRPPSTAAHTFEDAGVVSAWRSARIWAVPAGRAPAERAPAPHYQPPGRRRFLRNISG